MESARTGRFLALALLVAGLLALRLAAPEPLRQVQAIGFDLAQGLAPAARAESRLAVVHVGEASLARFGPWPWRRDRLAALVEDIAAQGASAVALDLLLDRPDRFSAEALMRTLGEALPATARQRLAEALSGARDADLVLASALERLPTALATSVRADAGAPGTGVFPMPTQAVLEPDVPAFGGVIAAIAPLREAALAEGAVNLLPEPDMVLRRAPVFFLADGIAHPSLPVAALMAAGRSAALVGSESGFAELTLDGARRPIDADGVVWLDFGRRDRIPVLEASALGTERASVLADRIVVLGLDAVGLSVPWRLADGGLASGPEVVALVADALDVGSTLARPIQAEVVEIAAMLAGMVVVVALWLATPPRLAAVATIGLVILWGGAAIGARIGPGVVLDPVVPVVSWAVVAASALAMHATMLWRARRSLVIALEERSRAAEAANRAKTRFLEEMHHDLRTPLNAVLGFSSLIETMPEVSFSPERGREYARTMTLAGEHILRLSERALQAAELTSSVPPRCESVDVNELALDAARIVLASRRFACRLETRPAPGPLTVRGDPAYLLEAVLNLLDNAFRHGGTDGEVILATSRPAPDRVAVDVLDHGPGMAPDLIAHVGTPFVPGRAEHEGVRGAGLGLYIVHAVVRSHGGRLVLSNGSEGGLQVRIELPPCETGRPQ